MSGYDAAPSPDSPTAIATTTTATTITTGYDIAASIQSSTHINSSYELKLNNNSSSNNNNSYQIVDDGASNTNSNATAAYGTYVSINTQTNQINQRRLEKQIETLIYDAGIESIQHWDNELFEPWLNAIAQFNSCHPSLSADTSPPSPIPRSVDFDWNAAYQKLYDLPTVDPIELKQRENQLRDLVSSFNQFALLISMVLVHEFHLPPDKKQIKPINVGGVMGGEKFIYNSIFFKFASLSSDKTRAMFQGQEELAQKSAANEIRAMKAMIELNVPQLHTTLTSMFYISGRVVIATAVAPIKGGDTLAYGSSDAANVIKKKPGMMRMGMMMR